jgi:hypothetical protein
MHSCIYEGLVRHRRHHPVTHEFRYGLFMMYLDLSELPGVFRGTRLWSASRPAPAWFRRSDHFGDPALPLERSVRDLVEERTGRRPAGPVRLLTHLRYFGYVFNPVSVFYCFGGDGARLEAVVAEVNNTPWGERHLYVLPAPPGGGKVRRRFAKEFHVSPFLDLDCRYDWSFSEPGRRLAVHMDVERGGRPAMDATLVLSRREISAPVLRRQLLRRPFMTAKVIAAIHAQAFRLWWKGAPVYDHPGRRAAALEER